MNFLFLLFEIGDKTVPVQGLYSIFLIAGGIGFLLGLWRWWLSLLWFIFPMSIIFAWHFLINIGDMYKMYDVYVGELGESYIWHSYISVIIGFLLNAAGIFIKIFRPLNGSLK